MIAYPRLVKERVRRRLLGGAMAVAVWLVFPIAAMADAMSDCEMASGPSAAVAACTRVVDDLFGLEETRRRAWSFRARAYDELGNYLAAVADYTALIEGARGRDLWMSDPTIDYLLARARAYERLRQWDKAIEDYQSAKSIDLKDKELDFLIGNVKMARGDYSGAFIRYMSAAVEGFYSDSEDKPINFTESEYVVAAAGALVASRGGSIDQDYARADEGSVLKNQYRDIGRLLDQVIAREPQNADAYFARANIARLTSDLTRADADYSMAIQLRADHAMSRFGRAVVRLANGKLDDAFADVDAAVQLDGGNADFYTLRAVIHGLRGDAKAQIADYGQVIGLAPLEADHYLWRSWAELRDRQPHAALIDSNRALALAPKLVHALLVRGAAYAALGYGSESARDWQAALKIEPKAQRAIDTLKRSNYAALPAQPPAAAPAPPAPAGPAFPPPIAAPPAAQQTTSCAQAATHWRAVEGIGSRAAYEDHLKRFPTCAFAGLAKMKIEKLPK